MVPDCETADHGDCHGSDQGRGARIERCCGNRDRCKDQKRKRVVESAGQEHQKGKLRNIEEKRAGHFVLVQTLVFRVDENCHEIGNDRGSDGKEAQAKIEAQIVEALGDGDGRQLAEDRDPAKYDQRSEPHPVGSAEARVECGRFAGQGKALRVRQAVLL